MTGLLVQRVVLAAVVGAGLLWWWSRRLSQDRRLGAIAVGSFLVRALLGVLLFFVSYYGWPFLETLQLGRGFWLFGPDSVGYHLYASSILDAFHFGVELPDPGTGMEYYLVVTGVYGLLGRHPLCGMLFNGWLAAASALLAYRIGHRLFGQRAALTAVLLVGFWPSSLLWSAQLLKDSVGIFLIFCALWVVVTLVPTASETRRASPLRWVIGCVLLSTSVMFLTRLRFYLGALFFSTAVIGLGVSVIRAALRREGRRSGVCAGLLLVIVSSTLLAREIDPWRLLSPRHPELGHVRLAVEALVDGEFEGAGNSYRKAIRLNPDYSEAYFGLIGVMLRQGGMNEAIAVLTVYMGHTRDAEAQATARQLIERILPLVPLVKLLGDQHEKAQLVPPDLLAWVDRLGGISIRTEPLPIHTPAPSIAGWVPPSRGGLGDSAQAPSTAGWVPPSRGGLGEPFSRLDDHALLIAHDMTPGSLGNLRQGFVSTGGYSLMDAWAQISSPRKLLTYLPRALAIGFLAPFPWQWFDLAGSTGIMRLFAGLEMVLIYLLMPAMLIGMLRLVKRRDAGGLFIAAFILLAATSMSLVVANLGSLFRLRLQFLLPLLIVAAHGEPLRTLIRLVSFFRGGREVAETKQAVAALTAPRIGRA